MAGRRYLVDGGDLCANEEKPLEEEELCCPFVAGVARGCCCLEAAGAAAAATAAPPSEAASGAGLEATAAWLGTITPPGVFPAEEESEEHAPGLATAAPAALARQSLSKVLATPVAGTVAHTGM